jgi:transposase
MFTRISKEIREEVTAKAKAGEKVAGLAKTYGISTKTIYGWLSKGAGDDSISILKYNKLKRENEELKRLLGEVTLKYSWGKKGRNGQRVN